MSARGNIPPDDVLRIIFEELEVPAPAASGTYHRLGWETDTVLENRRTLSRAACVCKAFYGHAVRVLWRHLDDLVPLLHLLSTFAEIGTGGHPVRSGTYVSIMLDMLYQTALFIHFMHRWCVTTSRARSLTVWPPTPLMSPQWGREDA